MDTDTQVPNLAAQRRRLLQFLASLQGLTGAFALLELTFAWVLSRWPLAVVGAATFSAFLAAGWARRLARQGRLKAAAILAGGSIIFVASVASPLAPYATASLVLSPIIGVATVLPYLRGRALLGFMGGAFAAVLWIMASGRWMEGRFQISRELMWVTDLFTTGVTAFMGLFLLWQFSGELRGRLDAEREARRRAEIARAQAQEAVRLRDEFLSAASHELRTPLTSLQLAIQGVREGGHPIGDEGLARAFALAERQVAKLRHLINGMLTTGRIQLGRLELNLEKTDLSEIVRDVASRFSMELGRARCPLELKLASAVGRWDADKLDQVVTNLLANAIKFGAGKPIEISVEEREETAVLRVVDHGIGIDPQRLPRLFQKFERAAPARAYGGLGLGLYITRTIVEALGGEVHAASPGPGGGATFTVVLPRVLERPLPGPPPAAGPSETGAGSAQAG